jgi:hypothetical protein
MVASTLKFDPVRSKADVVPNIRRHVASNLGYAQGMVPARGQIGRIYLTSHEYMGSAPAEAWTDEQLDSGHTSSGLWAGTPEVAKALGIPLHLFSKLEAAAFRHIQQLG